jgi:hypothetical protein
MNIPHLSRSVAETRSVDGHRYSVAALGSVVQRAGGGGGIPQPAPGCWLVGTQCRVGYQTCKFCCGDGRSYTQGCGWCIGWWDAPPCFR